MDIFNGKIGVLGGSFDPIHYGHLSIVNAARDELELDRVILMPAHISPFKLDKKAAPDYHRIAMANLAAEECKNVVVSTLETDAEEISYTYETLEALSTEYPDSTIYFLMGTDSFLELELWHRGEELLRNFSFCLAPRPGFQREEYEEKLRYYRDKFHTDVTVLHNELVPVSSTDIRNRIKNHEDISDLLPGKVMQYIYEHGLYQSIPE